MMRFLEFVVVQADVGLDLDTSRSLRTTARPVCIHLTPRDVPVAESVG